MTLRLLDISKEVERFLSPLPPKQFRQIYTKILSLRSDPKPNDYIKLSGSVDRYRVDIGEYRIIYSFNEAIVKISTVGKRNDAEVYKKEKRS